MRHLTYTVLLVLVFASWAASQNAPPPPAPPELKQVLRDWNAAFDGLKSLTCVVERQTLDKALGVRDESKGLAFISKPGKKEDLRIRLEMTRVGERDASEKVIGTSKKLYVYDPANKIVNIIQAPNGKALPLPNVVTLFTGIKDADRYELKLVEPNPPDKHYYYIQVRPKKAEDKSEFIEARISLMRSSNLPAQVWFLQPNRNEVTWSIRNGQANKDIPEKMFDPVVPPGWKVQNVNPLPMAPNKK
jgi:TIGR03009 family protein